MNKPILFLALVFSMMTLPALAAADPIFRKPSRRGAMGGEAAPVAERLVDARRASLASTRENVFGSDPDCAVPLPAGKAPKRAGALIVDAAGAVRLKPEPGAALTIDGKPATERVLGDDTAEKTDVVVLGDLSFFVIKRGERIGVRVKDAQSPVRTHFKGLDYYAADPRWRVNATFVPYDAPKKVAIPTVLGTTDTMEARVS